MKIYDVAVVGGGPAGGQTARELTKNGYKVLVIEKVLDFSKNNFSSAGSVMSIMKDYDLPESVVGSYWNKVQIWTSYNEYIWKDKENKGVVLDFLKLRKFLLKDVEVLFGTTVTSIEEDIITVETRHALSVHTMKFK